MCIKVAYRVNIHAQHTAPARIRCQETGAGWGYRKKSIVKSHAGARDQERDSKRENNIDPMRRAGEHMYITEGRKERRKVSRRAALFSGESANLSKSPAFMTSCRPPPPAHLLEISREIPHGIHVYTRRRGFTMPVCVALLFLLLCI